MKKYKYISVALALLLFVAEGIAAESVRLTEYVDQHGKRSLYVTTKDILEKCPTWKFDKEPPFPMHKALTIAEQWIKKKYPKFTSIAIESISLSRIWDDEYKDRWYYSISAEGAADLDGVSANSSFVVVVLMNGTVVDPISPKNGDY